jgi:hypothetical protein
MGILPRAGIYYWAGPGTIRMIRLKFFDPPIDEEGLMRSYDPDMLQELQSKLGVTDAWVTYSWGFSDETEREDRTFLRSRLENFKRLGIRTHAYVQGTNLVHGEFREDLWCRDHNGKRIPYHRGRSLCCPNNPAFRSLLLTRVEDACRTHADGVYVDNFHFGQFPVALGGYATFFGCACRHCERVFGRSVPSFHRLGSEQSEAYVRFRAETMHALLRDLRMIASRYGKQLGTNSFDQNLNARLTYGYDLQEVVGLQDYVLLENFNHPASGGSNAHHADLFAGEKPVFVVSYMKIIGGHPALSQRDIDAVHSESAALGYAPCYKATEFTTDEAWHNLDPNSFDAPSIMPVIPAAMKARVRSVPLPGLVVRLCNRLDRAVLYIAHEHKRGRALFGWIVDLATTRRMPS